MSLNYIFYCYNDINGVEWCAGYKRTGIIPHFYEMLQLMRIPKSVSLDFRERIQQTNHFSGKSYFPYTDSTYVICFIAMR